MPIRAEAYKGYAEAQHDFFWCAVCKRYSTFRWVVSLRQWECEDDAHKYGGEDDQSSIL